MCDVVTVHDGPIARRQRHAGADRAAPRRRGRRTWRPGSRARARGVALVRAGRRRRAGARSRCGGARRRRRPRRARSRAAPPGRASCSSRPAASGRCCPTPAPTTRSTPATSRTTLLVGRRHPARLRLRAAAPGSRGAALDAIDRARDAGMRSASTRPPPRRWPPTPAFLDRARPVDLLLPNERRGRGARAPDPRRARDAVVTLGAAGARWSDGARRSVHAACRSVDVVDTTGAGDAFAAGFLVRLAGARPRRRCTAGVAAGGARRCAPGRAAAL